MRPLAQAALLACMAATAGAQVFDMRPRSVADQWVLGFNAFGGFPLGDFARNEDGGAGFEGAVGFQPFRREPLLFRTHLAHLIYGSVQATGYQDVCDFFGCTTEEISYTARSHTMTSFHFGPEFFATDGFVRPYVYALGGWTWFYSKANEPPTSPGGPSPGSTKLYSSRNFSSAYGAGVRFVTTRFGREWGLELGSRVTRNLKANYLTDGGVHFDTAGNVTVVPVQSAANVLGVSLGVWFGPYINWDERQSSSPSLRSRSIRPAVPR